MSIRRAGSKLVFLDLLQDGDRVQVLCNLRLLIESGVSAHDFRKFFHALRRGDILSKLSDFCVLPSKFGSPHISCRREGHTSQN